jgi:polysaccharide biosynthesis transport protein
MAYEFRRAPSAREGPSLNFGGPRRTLALRLAAILLSPAAEILESLPSRTVRTSRTVVVNEDNETPRNAGGPTGRAEGINHLVVWQTVRKYWTTALSTAVFVALIVTFYTLGQTKIYQASATVMFDPNPPRPLGQRVEAIVEMGAGSYWDNREYYETQYRIIQSTRVALAVVGELGLQHDAAFLADLPPGAKVPPGSQPVSEGLAAEILKGRLRVEPIKDSRLATVRLEDADPQRAQRVLTTLVDAYVAQNLEDATASTSSAADWLRGQLDKLKVDLESSEMALHEYKERKNILSVAFDDQSNMLREEMKQINEALTSVRTKREEIVARRAELSKVRVDNPTNLPASELLQSVLLQDLRKKYDDAVRERDGLTRGGKGKNHPDVQAADGQIDAARDALLAEVKNIQGAVDGDLAVINRQEGGLAGLFERANKQALDLNLLEIEYNRLKRSKENTEKLYDLVLERTKETDLTRMLRINNIRVVDRPMVPGGPIRPQVPINIATGMIAGLLLGIGAAMGRAVIDRSIKTPDDVERELGVALLGLLPEIDESRKHAMARGRRRRRATSITAGRSELIVHEHPTSGVAEAARGIRTNLLFMSPDHPFRTLLVTSAGPSEGKTTVACCIAIAMAQAGQRVVLVDCDLRRPRIHKVFRKSAETGVTTALLEETVDGAVQPTDVPNLSIVATGPLPPNPAELLHSARFKGFLAQLSERFDRVILDSPPVVAVTDAAILSTLSDGTVLVVRAFATSKEIGRHALRALNDVGAKTAGAVLNAVNLDRAEYKYSYYYYRREGYGTDERPSSTPMQPESEAAPPPS